MLSELSAPKRLGKQYSNELRSFAVTLHYYSPRAYQFVREAFSNRLPHPQSVIRWYRSVDGDPGITSEAMTALQIKVLEARSNNERLLVCLMMDEVAIRRQIEWNHFTKRFEGSVQYAGFLPEEPDELPIAKEALVFMVTGIKTSFKIPVAYFLSDSLDTEHKARLVETVLRSLHDIGVTVIAFTFDGLNTNLSTANALGASLKYDHNFKTNFLHPCTSEPVYVLLDICHMLKLVRNTLAGKEKLQTKQGFVEWKYIGMLNKTQNLTGAKMAERLTDHHVYFQNEKMRVDLAAQTLSRSVAEALETLRSTNESFKDCAETIRFIRLFNDLFDVLNSKHSSAKGFKRPLNSENLSSYIFLFEQMRTYICDLQLQQEKQGVLQWKPIIGTVNKTGFLGFLIAIQSFSEMYRRHAEELEEISEICCYRLSQDHLESFFSAIRSRGGSNNNPTAVQFKAAYKRLIVNNNVTISSNANCQEFNEMKMLRVEDKAQFYLNCINMRPGIEENIRTTIDEAITQYDENLIGKTVDDCFLNNAISMSAVGVQKKLIAKIKCEHCLNYLMRTSSEIDAHGDILFICKTAELELKIVTNNKRNINVSKHYVSMINRSLWKILNDKPNVFGLLSEHILEQDALLNHRNLIIKLTADLYLKGRLEQYAKGVIDFKKPIRKKLTKLILFQGE